MTGFVKLAMIMGLAVLSWGVLFVLYQLWCVWPVAGAAGSFGLVGFTAGALMSGDVVRARVEPVQQRKDAAFDGAFEVAFSAQKLEQRVSGEHPTLIGDDLDPEPWINSPSFPRSLR